ncbi:hypothetical protein HMN09_00367000 [Mycena chlorophos]|uniref:Malate dehydrogenase n=1 Tax=Mycena chlorophos TaxID=658473 RepID=A0A8H6TKT8_MYCCL|nr:hypothetical protein HMN09_00367000 [Mycena chlorophos]
MLRLSAILTLSLYALLASALDSTTLGVGYQNYTCSSTTLTYSSIGALASLFDLSCMASKPEFADVQSKAYDIWIAPGDVKASANSIGAKVDAPTLLGYHYFINSPTSPGTGALSPEWDFTLRSHDPALFVVGAKVGDLPAPPPSDPGPKLDVDWLMLDGVPGYDGLNLLAGEIFRVETVGGQPPSSCKAGSEPIQVKYTAKYFLY